MSARPDFSRWNCALAWSPGTRLRLRAATFPMPAGQSPPDGGTRERALNESPPFLRTAVDAVVPTSFRRDVQPPLPHNIRPAQHSSTSIPQ
jgi:hypothetical protein